MIGFLISCTEQQYGDLLNVLKLIRLIITWLQILIPIALILFGTIDMGKAVIAGDEKKIKEAQKPFVKRLISAIIVFLLPFIVNLAINLVVSDATAWKACWNAAGSGSFTKINSSIN